jgi:hypothetical protein
LKGLAPVGRCLPEFPVKQEVLEAVQAVVALVQALEPAMTLAQAAWAEDLVLAGLEPVK